MNDRLIAIIIFFLLSFSMAALAADLEGEIRDVRTGALLPGVHVSISGTKIGASSDSHGRYRLKNLVPGEYEIVFQVIGYKRIKRKLIIGKSGITALNISLEQQPWELDEVVVTATRSKHILKDVPVTTELITREEMRETGALTVAQALESHIGVIVNDDLSGKGITLRGIDPSRVLILIDGHRVVGRVRGSIDLGQISLSDVEQIEIVKGSGSTLYGSDALGGVVNIITKKANNRRRLDSSIEFGSFKTFDPEFQFEGRQNQFGLLLSGKYEKTDGFDLLEDTPHTNGLERIKRFNLNGKLSFDPQGSLHNELSLAYMHEQKIWIESEWFEPLQRTFAYDDYEWNDRYDASLSSKYMFSKKTEAEASLHASLYDHKWEKYTSSGIQDDQSITKDNIIEISAQLNHSFSDAAIMTTGGDFAVARLESDMIAGVKRDVSFGDSYLQLEWIPTRSLTFLPGIRWERHKTYGDHINPSMNIKWSPIDRFALRGSAGRGFRAPSIKEIYFIFDHSAAGYIVYGGGELLDPETSNNYSLTAEFNYDRRGIHRLTLFRNDLENLIEFDLIEFNPTYWRGVYRYKNIIEARTEGIEWESEVKILMDWDFSFSYTYMTARNSTEDVKLINRPEHVFKVRSVFNVPRLDALLTLWGTYHDHKLWTSQGDTPDRTSDEYAPKRMIINLTLNKAIYKSLDGYFRIENITNDINATYGYWPPRSYSVGVRFNIFGGAE